MYLMAQSIAAQHSGAGTSRTFAIYLLQCIVWVQIQTQGRMTAMAIYEVSMNGKVVETFEAEDYFSAEKEFHFTDDDNSTVGSIVKMPGMTVKKVTQPTQRRMIG
jgi:hypothetical protein